MLSSKQIEIFYEVYKNSSMTAAAEKLEISQPSISKTLKNIEENLGFKLFLRKGKRLTPTHEAGELYEHASIVTNQLKNFNYIANTYKSRSLDFINIGTTPSLAETIVPKIIKEYKKILKYKKMIKFVYQNKPLGTGDAVLKTKKFIKNKFFLMLLPDDLIIKQNCSKSMIKVHKKYNSSVMASMRVDKSTVSRWGIYKLSKKISRNDYLINDVIEKPSVKNAPSNKAVIGRYILPKTIFKKTRKKYPHV